MNKKPSSFIFLTIGFIFATILGTLTHEGGHYFMAKLPGHDARINYGMTFLTDTDQVSTYHHYLITMAGPVETVLTGTIGLILLFIWGKKYAQQENLSFAQWILIFISLFWLRPVANLFIWIGRFFFTGKFSDVSDEIKIARHFHWPDGLILLITAVFGLTILGIVIFKFIPGEIRLVFITSGLVGGITGYVLWLKILGPVFLP